MSIRFITLDRNGAYTMRSSAYLMQSGVPGMKWGQRRYQNEDGTLTELGKIRYKQLQGKYNRTESKVATAKSVAKKYASAANKADRALQKNENRVHRNKANIDNVWRNQTLKKYYKMDMKSLEFQQKARRGEIKLAKYRQLMYDLVPPKNEHLLRHADSDAMEEFFKVLDTLDQEQKDIVYALFDEYLPDDLEHSDFLMHYRTPGSKNGQRLYQNEDGSLTPLGRIHYGVGQGRKGEAKKVESGSDGDDSTKKEPSPREKRKQRLKNMETERKNIRNLSDKDLQDRINRLNKEKQLDQLIREQNEREESPIRQKVTKLLTEAAESLAKKSLDLIIDKAVNAAKAKMNETKPFTLEKYKDVDLLSLKSDEIDKISDMFNKVSQVGINRNKIIQAVKTQQENINKQKKEAEEKAATEKKAQEQAKKQAQEKQERQEQQRKEQQEAADKRKAEREKKQAEKQARAKEKQERSQNDKQVNKELKNPNKPADSTVAAIQAMRNTGAGVKQIAAMLNLSEETVRKVIG